MTWWEAMLRLLLAVGIGLAIGLDREYKNKPAGTRTHLLVCIGAALIAIMENYIVARVVALNAANGSTGIAVNVGRVSAQVVSGIGFLGAGTIFSTHKKIAGLTTAASLWATGCLGLVAGFGCYWLAIAGFVAVMLTLMVIQHVLPSMEILQVEVHFLHYKETTAYIRSQFQNAKVTILSEDFQVEAKGAGREYTSIYTIKVPLEINAVEAFGPMSEYPNIKTFKMRLS